jgi:glucose-6-phosphate 1-dehydrogenase
MNREWNQTIDLQCTDPCVKPQVPCAMVVFGGSGDLTSRKLVPALYRLHKNNYLPSSFALVGCSRTEFTDDSYREHLYRHIEAAGGCSRNDWTLFAKKIHYQQIDYGDPTEGRKLDEKLGRIDADHGTAGNRLFYMAVPPVLYESVIALIDHGQLKADCPQNECWSRIVVEKPFGRDIDTAVQLDTTLKQTFTEDQIYRIDHYLAKETTQNILVFRFANALFEPVWNRQYISRVDIIATEELGIENRAGYYEHVGVLRDMFQNHMMQLLALIAMEAPSQFTSTMVSDEKAKLFQSLRPFDLRTISTDFIVGQYGPGSINNQAVCGYREEKGVDPSSITPTYAMLKLFIDNSRWQSVPFYLVSGKRLDRKETSIVVHFKDVAHSIFRESISPVAPNRLTFSIQPSEAITLSFQAKSPGTAMNLCSMNMRFSYSDNNDRTVDAYEKVLVDCLNGDKMLFLREDSEYLSWKFLTPVINDCKQCINLGDMLQLYPAGSNGPRPPGWEWTGKS